MSPRPEQTVSALRRAIQETLGRGLQDPRVRGLITVTEVQLSPDGREAIIGISVMPAEHQDLTLHGLRAASGHIRRNAAERIRIRRMPKLVFRLDKSLKKQAEVLGALAKAREEFDDTEAEAAAQGDMNRPSAASPSTTTPPTIEPATPDAPSADSEDAR